MYRISSIVTGTKISITSTSGKDEPAIGPELFTEKWNWEVPQIWLRSRTFRKYSWTRHYVSLCQVNSSWHNQSPLSPPHPGYKNNRSLNMNVDNSSSAFVAWRGTSCDKTRRLWLPAPKVKILAEILKKKDWFTMEGWLLFMLKSTQARRACLLIFACREVWLAWNMDKKSKV